MLARYLIDLALGTNALTHTHLLILRLLPSINTFPLQIIQQINHHGYCNIIIVVFEGDFD